MNLSDKNHHPRDGTISSEEKSHVYMIHGINSKPKSVTTLIHDYFPVFDADKVLKKMESSGSLESPKYAGKTPKQIKREWKKSGKEASQLGTKMHKCIEQYINKERVDEPDTKEFLMFLSFWKEFGEKYPFLEPYRTEWIVYDEDIPLAGSIDCVLENKNGELVILDWKRSKEIKMSNRYEKGFGIFSEYDNCNYSHYTLQLNIYRTILERKYKKRVAHMLLVVLHPNQDSYICLNVDRIDLGEKWNLLIKS